jgi:pimeloyl-ACP methyl ester carboxylesterase
MVHRRRMMTTQGVVVAVLALTSVAVPASAARASCNAMTFPVTVATLTQASSVSGTLCRKTNGANDRTVVITAHGATYNRSYWDWPQKPQSYSLIRRLLPSVSVLNIDLLGSGRSSHPVSAHLTQDAEASMLHQLVQSMRKLGFRRVVLLGHSSGSGSVTLAAARYHDVDGIVLTGFLHHQPGASVPLSMYPATFDPAFSDRSLDVGYLTTRPGSRTTNGFYNAAVADPSVIAYDEAHKDVAPSPQMSEFLVIVLDPSISRQVNVPVLSLVGANDGFCGSPACAPAADEPKAWSSAARLEVHVIPRAGHDIHLHGSSYADAESGYVLRWLTREFAHAR